MPVLLVADKNAQNANLLRRLVDADFEAELGSEPRDVRRRIAKSGWRALILDMLWSKDDPIKLLKELRGAGVFTHVLMLAGPRNTEETVTALDLGADDVLARPFEAEEFLARVRALVRRSEPRKSRALRIHDLEIDRQAHTVRRGGQTIALTPREFALLEILAKQPGKVVTRSAIWQHLYDDDERNQSNIVDVYIRYLRKKIDKGFDKPLILTRWGQGYLLRGENNGCAV